MTDGDKLAMAVVLFFDAGPWDARMINRWRAIMGEADPTTKSLGNLARKIIEDGRLADLDLQRRAEG